MARVLLTWELGAGLGHLVNLAPFARSLSERGHQVFAALKDVTRADRVLADADVSYLQAPISSRRVAGHVQRPHTFAQILYNCGFGETESLRKLTEAWRHLFEFVQPDLIVFDHSPTALLASRSIKAARCLIGTGFFSPPDVSPLPNLRPVPPADPAVLRRHEDQVLENANAVLQQWNQPPLGQISDLYSQVDENFLATYPELDHYPDREGGQYVGAWPLGVGEPPRWPSTSGTRIFAYLKPFAALPSLLQTLSELRHPTLIYADGLDPPLVRKHASQHMHFQHRPLELELVGKQCDLAILNGNHGTTVAMLLAGKPTLHIPLYLEQGIFARSVERIGAGLCAASDNAGMIRHHLRRMLQSDSFGRQAKAFATRYADFDITRHMDAMLDRTESLLPQPASAIDAPASVRAERAPSSLVHPRRFDVMAKYLYAKHRQWGLRSTWARDLYLAHLRVWNNFFEKDPPKSGPDDFLLAFDALLDSVGSEGFLDREPPVAVGNDDALINGAHRLAACLSYQKPVTCEIKPEPGADFSSGWFRRRTRHVSTGLPMTCGDPMALEYARLKRSCRLLLMATSAEIDEGALLTCLRDLGDIVYPKRLQFDRRAMQNLMRVLHHRRLLHSGEPTSPSEMFGHNVGDYQVRLFLYEWKDGSNLTELRHQLALLDDSDCMSVIATHDESTTVELAELLFGRNGIGWLRAMDGLPSSQCDQRLADLDEILADTRIPSWAVCLTGEALPAVPGRGDCRRLDVLLASSITEVPTDRHVRFHRELPQQQGIDADEVIANPRWHFYYRGFKFLV